MRITEAFQILPKLLVAVVVVSLVGSGLANEILVIGLLSWPATARVIRGRVQVIRHEEFIAAAEMSGASWVRVLVRHVDAQRTVVPAGQRRPAGRLGDHGRNPS